MGRWGRRRRQLLYDLEETRCYCNLKEEAPARTFWKARFGRGYCPVVRQNMMMMMMVMTCNDIPWYNLCHTGDNLAWWVAFRHGWPAKRHPQANLTFTCSWTAPTGDHWSRRSFPPRVHGPVLQPDTCSFCMRRYVAPSSALTCLLLLSSLSFVSRFRLLLFLDIVSFHLSSVSNSLSTPPKPLSLYSVAASAQYCSGCPALCQHSKLQRWRSLQWHGSSLNHELEMLQFTL